MTHDELWAWAVSVVPKLATLTPEPKFTLDAWAPPGGAVELWFDARQIWDNGPARCVSLRFEPQDHRLGADVAERYGLTAGAPDVWTYTLWLGYAASMVGPGRVRRDGSTEALGGLRVLGRTLSDSSRNVLRYDGVRFEAEIACPVENLAQDPRCPACERCMGFELEQRTLDIGLRGRSSPPVSSSMTSSGPPQCEPCPPEERLPLLPRLQRAVKGRVFVSAMGEGPAFFRDPRQCAAELRAPARPKAPPRSEAR